MTKSGFQLINHRLVDVKYHVNKAYKPKTENISLDIGYQTLINREKDANKALVTFIFTIFKDEKDTSKYPFKIETTHEGEFEWPEDTPDDRVNSLLKINAPAIMLSYDRSIISMITTYSGMAPLIIPLINFKADPVSSPGEPIDQH
ncbi:preprotein translocase subunit SecB [Sphaerochaeta pleomorpha str. Grapes]|uniref:Preprotein translocase subunit SecB n=1 Tax=Sphaerochaeta pleomorpha (strain ATCC BAA-1885 / DSM 22778 / Grapes) TaxID=158190 RepID=G8QWE4_SPHPG|nr:protein-export chaperone SecB [Sphaerochaeta pleomorpha]AEV29442.1 preprotein translocase subunit SecB [Sphaerochaeta pleomorpha str. Grapes]